MAQLLLIEDDDTTREVLGLLLRADGWEVAEAESGEAALALAVSAMPEVVLCDLQLPGICGTALALALRDAFADGPAFVAMTATQHADLPDGYDCLLVKPFEVAAVREALSGFTASTMRHSCAGESVIVKTTFDQMKTALPAPQLLAMYDVALRDAEARVHRMEKATEDVVFRREAHALKGSCGMIGASRLRSLAASAEECGLREIALQRTWAVDFRREILIVRRMLERLLPRDM